MSRGGTQTAVVVATDAQIKALPTTRIQVVAAPGANRRINFHSGTLVGSFTAGAYTNVNADAWGGFALNSGAIDVSAYFPNDTGPTPDLTKVSDFFAHAFNAIALFPPFLSPDSGGTAAAGWGAIALVGGDYSGFRNTALELHIDNAAAGNFTGGNAANSMIITVEYSIAYIP